MQNGNTRTMQKQMKQNLWWKMLEFMFKKYKQQYFNKKKERD